jgi:hypothetical protein
MRNWEQYSSETHTEPWATENVLHNTTVSQNFLLRHENRNHAKVRLVFKPYACALFSELSTNHGSFLVTIMGLVVPWSFTLAMIDVYSVVVGCPLRVPGVMAIVVAGDWVCTT